MEEWVDTARIVARSYRSSVLRVVAARVCDAMEAWVLEATRVRSKKAVQDTDDCNHLFQIWW